MIVYVDCTNYNVLTINKYNAMRETMIADAVNDSNDFEEWLDYHYNISKIFFLSDEERNEIWDEWVKAKIDEVDDNLETYWHLRELEVVI